MATGGRAVRIELSVRRLYCENPACPKVTSAEQADGLTVRRPRRTPLLQALAEMAGILPAGRGGARLPGLPNAPLCPRTGVLLKLMRVNASTPPSNSTATASRPDQERPCRRAAP